jgi:hypothetical protein
MKKEIRSRASELYNSGLTSKTDIARELTKEFPGQSLDSLRMIAQRIISKTNKGIDIAAKIAQVGSHNVPYLWLKSKEASLFVKNPHYRTVEIDFDKIISECMDIYKPIQKIEKPNVKRFDRLIWTDVHVGMDASRKGLALYPEDWNAGSLMCRIDIMVDFTIANKTSDLLVIDELGDFLDGYDGYTTRGGHKLPQNMTNEEAFDNGLKAKVYLIERLSKHYTYIRCNNICEDNHAGSFGYILNSAFKSVIDCKYENVEVTNIKRFIDHYIIGDHGFIISHGKDSRNLKFGFKPQLDPKSAGKISEYIRMHHDLRCCKFIEFSKGDSHQALFDMASSDEFDYFNYPAFSPSSEWVQTNFKKGRSGFVLQHIDMHSDRKDLKTYFFN